MRDKAVGTHGTTLEDASVRKRRDSAHELESRDDSVRDKAAGTHETSPEDAFVRKTGSFAHRVALDDSSVRKKVENAHHKNGKVLCGVEVKM